MTRTRGWEQRASGVLLGQACGDALGVPYEFAAPPVGKAQMLGGGLGPYAPGEWSDDTQMAVVIAEVTAQGLSLVPGPQDGPNPAERSTQGLDEVADGFERWLAGGASDVGTHTRRLLRQAASGRGRPAARLTAASRALHADTGHTAGNGALMRTSVLGLTHLDDREATARAAAAVAGLTHADPLAADSCVLWSEAVRVAVTQDRFDLVSGLDLLPAARRGHWRRWIDEATGAEPASFGNNGYTVTALQAAWAAISGTPVPQACGDIFGTHPCEHLQGALQAAVRAGNDTDTVAAIAGGLLGARWGASAVPQHWRGAVHGWPGLRGDDLVRLALLTATGDGT